jgi:hypothetical protein
MSILASDEVSWDTVANVHNIMVENETHIDDYMLKHKYITKSMRYIVVDWLFTVHYGYKLNYGFSEETFFRTINILDRFLTVKNDVTRKYFQLYASASFLLATKIEEDWDRFDSDKLIEKLVYLTDSAFTVDELIQSEIEVLKTLDFNLLHVVHCDFIDRITYYNDEELTLTYHILKIVLFEYDMTIKWKSSILVRAIMTVVKKIPEVDGLLLQCIKEIKMSLINLPPKTLVSFNKYSKERCKVLAMFDAYEKFIC